MTPIEMGRKFHAAAGISGEFNAEDFAATVAAIDAAGGLFTSEAGMIGGLVAPAFYNSSHLIAYELFWWAEDGTGIRLLRKFERWAAASGANEIRISTLASLPGAERGLRGYVHVENGYRKVI